MIVGNAVGTGRAVVVRPFVPPARGTVKVNNAVLPFQYRVCRVYLDMCQQANMTLDMTAQINCTMDMGG